MSDRLSSLKNPQLSVKNTILNALPQADFERLLPELEKVDLQLGQVIYRPEETIEYVYFPNSAIVSVIATTISGQSAETGVIGSEGMTGIDVLLGSDSTLLENIVQLSNSALRMKTAAIRREFKRGEALQNSLLRFIRLLLLQISQTALCNRLHMVEERLARWLLLCRDRSVTDELKLTQEFLSIMLGTNRATVTMAAIELQNIGYIKYSRGLITILDRYGLEDFCCDCYQTVKKEYDKPLK